MRHFYLQHDKEYQTLLTALKTQNIILPLDESIASFLTSFYPDHDCISLRRFHFLMLWLSIEVRAGHICLALSTETYQNFLQRFLTPSSDEIMALLDYPSAQDLQNVIQNSGLDLVALNGDENQIAPLVYQNQWLYFQRMWKNEQKIARFFNQSPTLAFDRKTIASIVAPLFAAQPEPDFQKIAVENALLNPIAIISGGPGTGKTTTVAKLLLALLKLYPEQTLSICAATPTGKASARLTQSLNSALQKLDLKQLHISAAQQNQLQLTALTLHKLLGAKPNRNEFKYHAQQKLPYDVVLIDEASMIDLSMMAHLIEALRPEARLILLGDKDQLSSVEAGAIFGDLCAQKPHQYEKLNSHKVSFLEKSFRFSEDSGIKKWADFVNQGEVKQTLALLQAQKHSDIQWHRLNEDDAAQYAAMIQDLAAHYEPYFQGIENVQSEEEIKSALTQFDRFRVLCALNESAFGIHVLNKQIQDHLIEKGQIKGGKSQQWYNGKPVMITENNAFLTLFNGDIGIAFKDKNGHYRVHFLSPENTLKTVSTALLPKHETAFAMTIHKSQGSEFDEIAIVLPTQFQTLLTRSLLYTAITRARKKAILYSSKKVFEKTIESKQKRQSGLSQLLT